MLAHPHHALSHTPPRLVLLQSQAAVAVSAASWFLLSSFSLVWLPRWVSPFWHLRRHRSGSTWPLFLSSGVAPSSVDLLLVCGSGWAPEAHRVGSPRPRGTIPCLRVGSPRPVGTRPCAHSHLSPGWCAWCLPFLASVLSVGLASWATGELVYPTNVRVGAPGLAPSLPCRMVNSITEHHNCFLLWALPSGASLPPSLALLALSSAFWAVSLTLCLAHCLRCAVSPHVLHAK